MFTTNTARYAERELSILSQSLPDPDNRPIVEPFTKEILSLCEAFGKSGQSGGSAPYTATAISRTIKKLLLQEPICPITGVDEEWTDVTELNDGTPMFQNKRCSAVFKDGRDGRAYYLDAIVFKSGEDNAFTSNRGAFLPDGSLVGSCNYIKSFPFTPKTFYISVVDKEVAKDNWEHYIVAPGMLKRVFKYYDRK